MHLILVTGAGAIAQDGSTKIQRYYGGYPADNRGSALQCVIRNIKDEKLFVGLGHANVVSVREHHENIPPCLGQAQEIFSIISNMVFFGKVSAANARLLPLPEFPSC
jgi:hypothetical protein